MPRNAYKLIPTILCGGAGSRLWPVSRELHPKPFIRLADGQSLLQKALLRGAALDHVAEVLTVTNRELFFMTRDEYRAVQAVDRPFSFLLEPFGRNTAPAIAMAALHARKRFGDEAVLLVLSADHLITDQAAFATAVKAAVVLAQQKKLVTFGIKPDRPETGYGYIEAEGSAVLRFVEKPSLEIAQGYVESGRFLWNAGMFCFTADTVLREMARWCPAVLEAARTCFDTVAWASGKGVLQGEFHGAAFEKLPDISIDFALMEKSDAVAVVPCDIGWSDIGSWQTLGDLQVPDSSDNRIEGDVFVHASSGCTIRSEHRLVGAVGVKNLIIVDTPDALLVADKAHAQDVRHVYAALKTMGHDAHKVHRTVHHPWGTYTVLEEGAGFKIKRIKVNPQASLSLQAHRHRCEHWVVVYGTAQVTNGARVFSVATNESTYIPAGHRHRMTNPSDEDLVVIEVQTGAYLGEDDITRFEDHYERGL